MTRTATGGGTFDGLEGQAPFARQMVEQLRGVVKCGRRRWAAVIVVQAVTSAMVALLAYLLFVLWLDNVVHLPVWGRLAASAVFYLAVIAVGYRLWRWRRRVRLSLDQVALAIERRSEGALHNRLVNALQLARQDDAPQPQMIEAVVEENYRRLQQAQMNRSAALWPVPVAIGALAIVLAGAGGYWAADGGEQMSNAASRIFSPFADIEPIYQTTLIVEPGDVTVKAGDDVAITVSIQGRLPQRVSVLIDQGEDVKRKTLTPDKQARQAVYTFKSVQRSIVYRVRGGDFTTGAYTIHVPMPLELSHLSAVYQLPQYTQLPPRRIDSATGDLEALAGTTASCTFVLNQPADEAWLILHKKPSQDSPDGGPGDSVRQVLEQNGATEFAGRIVFDDVVGYHLQCRYQQRAALGSRRFHLRVLGDQAPSLQLTGLESDAQIMIDAVLPVTVSARDDYGLAQVGLFYRMAPPDTIEPVESETDLWTPVEIWPMPDPAVEFEMDHELPMGLLDVVEGDLIELAVRGRDHAPVRSGAWTTGPRYRLTVTSPGGALQLLYEQILKTQRRLRQLMEDQDGQVEQAGKWIKRLDQVYRVRWDEKKNLDALAAAMDDQAQAQNKLRDRASAVAKQMVEQAGSLRLSVAMLADTEMVRSIRQLRAVTGKDNNQQKRATLADARLTQQRVVRSLREINEQYVQFRKDWELSHMMAFTKMLADRQQRMAEATASLSSLSADALSPAQRSAVARRQQKVLELANLAQTAFAGMVEFEPIVGKTMADAFGAAAQAFDDSGLKADMVQAGRELQDGWWPQAVPPQRRAAGALANIHLDLKKAQTLAAREALTELEQLVEGDAQLQQALAQLRAGSAKNLLDLDPDAMVLDEIVHMRKLAEQLKNKKLARGKDTTYDHLFEEHMKELLTTGAGDDQHLSGLKLPKKPGGQMSSPNYADLEGNRVKPNIQEKYDDLVGDLLDEADDLRDDYETYNLNVDWKMSETGEILKQGGDINSTSASAPTGNMKVPTNNSGGASRSGRQGARAHGLSVGQWSVNRRGRDEAQEGDQQVPDQDGFKREILSDDPQQDTSTGIGGKQIDEDQASFSVKDSGEWKDDMVDRLGAPKSQNLIVERKGKPLHPRVAEAMRDLSSGQEQVIRRIKALKKQLDQLYLPTDHLDDLMGQMKANMDRLKDKPDAEVFRRQVELLDELKSTVIVFHRPSSEFEQSLQRDQLLRGRVVDEPPRQTIPGYEAAVKQYYKKLSGL